MKIPDIIEKVKALPQSPGVYLFRDGKKVILYIGKATNLRSRVQSYFRGGETRGHIEAMMPSVVDVDFLETDSVLEALILESNLIKKHQPKYNVKEKDDKSFSYFVITKEEFPRVLIVRKTDLDKNLKSPVSTQADASSSRGRQISNLKSQSRNTFGPYTSKKQMEVALKILRKIFPFHSRSQHSEQGCLDFQLGNCPGPYAGAISKADYAKNIRGIRMILAGQKKGLVKKLEKEMQLLAKKHAFEKAAELRNKIFALNHIRDVALISREEQDNFKFKILNLKFRIEAYDISNLSGQQAVGSMVVFENGEPDKKEYRKFKIKTVVGANDVAMMREVLLRRLMRDWPQPELMILDGGKGHLHMAEKLLQELGLVIPLAAVAKGPTRKKLELATANLEQASGTVVGQQIEKVLQDKNLLKHITDEAHRFAISYHRKVRKGEYLREEA